jgi:hypothetical protein
MRSIRHADEGGFALLTVLLLLLVIGGIAMAGVAVSGNASLVGAVASRQARMTDAAEAGVEMGRAYVNRHPGVYPDSSYVLLDPDAFPLRDALGRSIPGLTRRVYVGPSGISTGQFGIYGGLVSVVEDRLGNRVVVHGEVYQESFAKFAYFTDKETDARGNPIYFAPGDQLFGPVHSNDVIRVMAAGDGPVFHGPVTTHQTVSNSRYATFQQGLQQRTARIEMPDLASLNKLRALADPGRMTIIGNTSGGVGQATTRIEFVAIDLDGDGQTTGENEGFVKVYTSSDARWVVSGMPSTGLENSPNCGHRHLIGSRWYFYTAQLHDNGSARDASGHLLEGNANAVLKGRVGGQPPRCYLGGSDSLNTNLDFVPATTTAPRGQWLRWGGSWATPMPPAIAARADREYLFPLGRLYNPDFKGVIYVSGKVAISGVLRGRVTLATTGDIVIADDVVYATDPAGAGCDDILGLFAGGDIVVADNTINSPVDLNGVGNDFRTYDATSDEVINAVLLTLGSFTVQNYDDGSDSYERCEGDRVGRGCLYVTGGIIQDRRGAVGQSASHGATGYLKRYAYDQCASSNPPPYFPTTGYFVRSRTLPVDPTGFDVDDFFRRLTP